MRNAERSALATGGISAMSSPSALGADNLGEALSRIQPHDHACLIYDTEEEWRAATSSALATGLQRGEMCLYLGNTHSADTVRESLIEAGADADAAIAGGRLVVLRADESYTLGGFFDVDRSLSRLIDWTAVAVSEGCTGLRVVGEADWMLSGIPGSEDLMEYESRVNSEVFQRSLCSAICLYDRREFSPEILKSAILTHPFLIVSGRICANVWYTPPEEFLTQSPDERELKSWMKTIVRAQDSQSRAEFLADIVERSSQPFAVRDADLRLVACNRAYCDLLGYTEEELAAMDSVAGIFPEGCKDQLRAAVDSARTILGPVRAECVVTHKDGSTKTVESMIHAVPNSDGTPRYYCAFHADITERKLTDKALRESENRYRELVENVQEGIWLVAPEGAVQFVNHRAAEMLGRPIDEILGMPVGTFAFPTDGESISEKLARRSRGISESYDCELLHKDGTRTPASVHAWPRHDADGQYLGSVAFASDMTEHRELEAQLQQSRKLETLGAFTGGIAHEFKNLLMGISGYAEMLQMRLGLDHPRHSDLLNLLQCVDRASRLTNQLLAFSRRQAIELRPIVLNELVTDTKSLLTGLLGERVHIELDLDPNAGTVNVDAGQIEQVLLNLAINARDAMPQGGRLSISTGPCRLDHLDTRKCPWLEPGDYARLSVADTGPGIDGNTAAHLFDPFFTTKERGAGLGLAVVYGIVKQHRGCVCVDSEPGEGATFRVYLPATGEESERSPGATRAAPTRGHETILLAEDEEMVRAPAKSVLEEHGYTVLCAGTGDEAIKLFAQHADEIDLAVLDMVMPGADGREVWRTINQARPEVPVIFTSGYTLSSASEIADMPGATLVMKPFSLFDLAARVREQLDLRR